jgi:hypothetical protein
VSIHAPRFRKLASGIANGATAANPADWENPCAFTH